MKPRSNRAAMLCVMCVLVAVPAFAQNADDAFSDGVEALNKGNVPEAEKDFRRAISLDPKESTRIVGRGILGAIIRKGGQPYLPHVMLGEALLHQKRCVEAIATWAESERQKVAADIPSASETLQNGYARCEALGVLSPARYVTFRDRATTQLADARSQAEALEGKAKANAVAWTEAMQTDSNRARGEIDGASRSFDGALKSRLQEEFTRVGAAVERAKTMLASVSRNLDLAIAAHESANQQARGVRDILTAAEALDRQIEERGVELAPTQATQRQYARDAIGRAQARMTEALRTTSPAGFAESRSIAGDAVSTFRQVLSDLDLIEKTTNDQRLASARARSRESFSLVASAYANLERLVAERPTGVAPELTTARDELRRAIDAARRRNDEASKAGDVDGLQDVARTMARARSRLDTLSESFGPLTLADRGVHPALAEGSRLFLSGDYSQALAALSPSDDLPPEVPLQLHVHLFRAASLHALFLRSRESDESLRTQAAAEIERVRDLNPEFQPDPRAFSPRFLSFYRSGGAAPAAPPATTP